MYSNFCSSILIVWNKIHLPWIVRLRNTWWVWSKRGTLKSEFAVWDPSSCSAVRILGERPLRNWLYVATHACIMFKGGVKELVYVSNHHYSMSISEVKVRFRVIHKLNSIVIHFALWLFQMNFPNRFRDKVFHAWFYWVLKMVTMS